MALDHIGPILVNLNNQMKKIFLLIITCLKSRAIHLELCSSLDNASFLRAINLHVMSYGIFQFCYSDQGSSLVSGINTIRQFLNDPATISYLESKGVKRLEYKT